MLPFSKTCLDNLGTIFLSAAGTSQDTIWQIECICERATINKLVIDCRQHTKYNLTTYMYWTLFSHLSVFIFDLYKLTARFPASLLKVVQHFFNALFSFSPASIYHLHPALCGVQRIKTSCCRHIVVSCTTTQRQCS